MLRARLSLVGLSVGDAFGEQFFVPRVEAELRISARELPPPPWNWTDDTAMALAIVAELGSAGEVRQDSLALAFSAGYMRDPWRGYGSGARRILLEVASGAHWRQAAASAFGGEGSLGNGAAMRAGPLGAYFADDLEHLVPQALASAEVTHHHPEGQAGAAAVALAAAYAWRSAHGLATGDDSLLQFVFDRTPESETRRGIGRAIGIGPDAAVSHAAAMLGAGERVSAPDTVPFALWCASLRLDDYEEAQWTTVAGLGDRDTTCAIVGSIAALHTGREGIPGSWAAAREPLPDELDVT
jgi:ADP-ribosylglycohydrolase